MKTIAKNKPNLIISALKEKCPHCRQGEVFKKNKLFQIPVMNRECSVCSYHFDREPGYFIGAMYLSYGLAILQAGIAFLPIPQSIFVMNNFFCSKVFNFFIGYRCFK